MELINLLQNYSLKAVETFLYQGVISEIDYKFYKYIWLKSSFRYDYENDKIILSEQEEQQLKQYLIDNRNKYYISLNKFFD